MGQYFEQDQEANIHERSQYGGYTGSQQFFEYQRRPSEQEASSTYNQLQEVQSAPPLDYASFAAILCYAVGWASGLFFLIFEQRNRYVRFHALQSIIFFGGINLLDFALLTSARLHIFILFRFSILFFLFVNFFAFVCWIIAMIHASRGTYFRLPLVGWFVARFVNRRAALK